MKMKRSTVSEVGISNYKQILPFLNLKIESKKYDWYRRNFGAREEHKNGDYLLQIWNLQAYLLQSPYLDSIWVVYCV